jgi:hypothetical protein
MPETFPLIVPASEVTNAVITSTAKTRLRFIIFLLVSKK